MPADPERSFYKLLCTGSESGTWAILGCSFKGATYQLISVWAQRIHSLSPEKSRSEMPGRADSTPIINESDHRNGFTRLTLELKQHDWARSEIDLTKNMGCG